MYVCAWHICWCLQKVSRVLDLSELELLVVLPDVDAGDLTQVL